MKFKAIHRFLLDRGMAYVYALFIAGYFLLPMASGHRRLYYLLVLPAILLLWRELADFYRHNVLAGLLLLFATYMMATLLWTADFEAVAALQTLGYAICVLGFCYVSGYLWVRRADQMDRLAHRATWLAAGVGLVSIVVWYLGHPFPVSRLEPLGVMHHQNKAGSAYGVFLVLCMHYIFTERGRDSRAVYSALALALLSLVVLTQSRTAMTAVCVGLIVLVGYRALAVAAVGMAALWALMASSPEVWVNRVGDFSFRPAIWEQVLVDMQGYWWFGHGYLIDPRVPAYDRLFDHAHNAYLATLRDGGLVGLMLLAAILGVALHWAWQLYRQRGERIYLALLLYGMTSVAMDYDRLLLEPRELWLFFWLPVALIMAAHPVRHEPVGIRYPGHDR
ncbi:MAG: O-antigen ligase family protein [Halioglobus sp.]|nr:O-antigen ligase family protein [Halioglobus sp.]